jgi:cytochrome c oxidase assembly factor CtaG
MRAEFARLRPWLAVAGAVLAIGVLVPPAGTEARRYVFAQAVQFGVLAVVVPAFVVLGAPWQFGAAGSRLARLRSRSTATTQDGSLESSILVNAPRPGLSIPRASAALLVGFIAIALAWRLPPAVNALVRYPALTVIEAVTLIGAGCALWLELVESPPLRPRISRPLRAAFAVLPMWSIWASAYIMGFSRATWFTALARRGGLSTVADQQIAAAVLFAIAGLAFVPVVYVSLITWLRDTARAGDECRAATGPVAPRPPRGWRRL